MLNYFLIEYSEYSIQRYPKYYRIDYCRHHSIMSDKIRKHIKATKNVNPRKDRGKTQRIYLLRIHDTIVEGTASKIEEDDISDTSDDTSDDTSSDTSSDESSDISDEMEDTQNPPFNSLERKFDLCGTTGNVYTVTIDNSPVCTCPDHTQRKNRCKHIFFILIRIMKVGMEKEDKLEYEDDELTDMFKNMPMHMTEIQSGVKADSSLLSRYSNMQIRTDKDGTVKRQRLTGDTRCPVCLDLLRETRDPTSHCKYGCGTVVHNECAKIYNEHRRKTGYSAICFVCQKKWNPVGEPDTDSYLNIQN
jgi:hypothetical protein